MYRVSVASDAERDEILSFLERRGLVENAELIADVAEPFRGGPEARVIVCRRGRQVVGVMYSWPVDRRPGGWEPPNDYWLEMDAVNRQAAEALINALPSGEVGGFEVRDPVIQGYFDALPDATRRESDLYFTVSLQRFRPVAGEDIVEVTVADAGLFEGCERQPNWEHMADEWRRFAIVRSNRVATRTGVGPVTPKRERGPRVVAISGLYTETRYRRMGLAKRLVSCVTEMILRDGDLPMCWTEPDNIVSARLFRELGYWQYAQRVDYLWRRPGR